MLSLSLVSTAFGFVRNELYFMEGKENFQDQGATAVFWDSGDFPGVTTLS